MAAVVAMIRRRLGKASAESGLRQVFFIILIFRLFLHLKSYHAAREITHGCPHAGAGSCLLPPCWECPVCLY